MKYGEEGGVTGKRLILPGDTIKVLALLYREFRISGNAGQGDGYTSKQPSNMFVSSRNVFYSI